MPIECEGCPDFIETTYCGWRAGGSAVCCRGILKHEWFITAYELAKDPHIFDLQTLRNAEIASSKERWKRRIDLERRQELAHEYAVPLWVEDHALFTLRILDVRQQLEDLRNEIQDMQRSNAPDDLLSSLLSYRASPTPPEVLVRIEGLHRSGTS